MNKENLPCIFDRKRQCHPTCKISQLISQGEICCDIETANGVLIIYNIDLMVREGKPQRFYQGLVEGLKKDGIDKHCATYVKR